MVWPCTQDFRIPPRCGGTRFGRWWTPGECVTSDTCNHSSDVARRVLAAIECDESQLRPADTRLPAKTEPKESPPLAAVAAAVAREVARSEMPAGEDQQAVAPEDAAQPGLKRPEPGQSGISGLLDGDHLFIKPENFDQVHDRDGIQHRLKEESKWKPLGIGSGEEKEDDPEQD